MNGSSGNAGNAKRRRTEEAEPEASVSNSKKYGGAAIYKTKFNAKWQEKWSFIIPVKNNPHLFHCTACNKDASCGHQGETDVMRHIDSIQHKKNSKTLQNNTRLSFPSTSKSQKDQVIRAELKITNLLIQHNKSLSLSDHLGPMFLDIFPDSDIAKSYSCARTTTTCIVNGAIAPHFKSILVEQMKRAPFSFAIDGSNDNGVAKMSPLTVHFFKQQSGMVSTQLLDMCLTKGRNSGTAETIFLKMNEVFMNNQILPGLNAL
jgi:hypothetical protein